ncbi:Uncharacterized protein Rs2_05083 [Raphanus sativus]|nr:Uncharacterized protein Rs2_05083 [Raphanus sativus]
MMDFTYFNKAIGYGEVRPALLLLCHVPARQFRQGFLLPPQLKLEPPWPSSHNRTTSANQHELRLRSQLCAGFSATRGPLCGVSSSWSSRSLATTIAHNHRHSSFADMERPRPILGLYSSSCLALSRPSSPDSGFAVGIEVKRSSNGDFLDFCKTGP